MSSTRMEAALGDLAKKVASLTAAVAAQTVLIEAQNKKIEDQHQVIENYFLTTNELKRVIEEMPAKIIDLWHAEKLKSESELPAEIPSASSASETNIPSEVSVQSQNMTQRALRAMKRANKATSTASTKTAGMVETVSINESSEEWKVVGVQKKAKNPYLKAVQTGGNTQIDLFQAVQKKKFLHVWSLHPDTSEKSIIEHVKNVCGSEDIKVEKIIPKTKRDYSSFMIGVPESTYEKLNNADSWPINTRFNEWVWFRNSRQSAKGNEAQS